MLKPIRFLVAAVAAFTVLSCGVCPAAEEESPYTAPDTWYDDYKTTDAYYGEYYGTLVIESAGINVNTYYADSTGGGSHAQQVVDALNSCAYFVYYNFYAYADHNDQDFANLTDVKTGDIAYLLDEDGGIEKVYECVKTCQGYNDGTLYDDEWNDLEYLDNSDVLMYTCLSSYNSVYMTFWDVVYDSYSSTTGWIKYNGRWHYFDTAGMVTGWASIDGSRYFFNDAGEMVTGWLETEGGKYYLDSSGVMLTGWQDIDGTKYYFKNSGKMATGWTTLAKTDDPTKSQAADTYYFNDSGKPVTGLFEVSGQIYFAPESGRILKNQLYRQDGNWYYYGSDGVRVHDCACTIDGITYMFGSDGRWISNLWV